MKSGLKFLIVACLVVFVTIAGYFVATAKRVSTAAGHLKKDRVIQLDLETLENKESNPFQFFAAIIREAEMRNPKAFEIAQSRAHDSQPWVRAGCAETLGYVKTDEAFNLQIEMLHDSDQNVRERALRGLAHRGEDKALVAAKSFFLKDAKTPQDKIAALLTIIKLSHSENEKTDDLKKIVEQARGTTLADAVRLAALRDAAEAAPNSMEVIELMAKELRTISSPSRTQELAIRHLASFAPDRLRDLLRTLKSSPDTGIRLAVVQAIPFACPTDRWDLLKDFVLNDPEMIVWSEALKTTAMMPGEGAQNMISDLHRSPEISKEFDKKDQVETTMKQLADSKLDDPCRAAKSEN